MKEYIDRNALLKDICGNDPSHMEDYYFNAIANAPTADVVEVVRCKDCTHGHWNQELCHGKPIYYCDRTDLQVGKYDFCSCGERKEQK